MRATCSLCLSFQKIEVVQFPKKQMTQETNVIGFPPDTLAHSSAKELSTSSLHMVFGMMCNSG